MITSGFWEYIKKNPIFKSTEVTSLKIKRSELDRLVQTGKIQKIGRGLFSTVDYKLTENTTVVQLMKRMPSAVLSHLSALQFYGITSQNPHQIWVTVKNGTWVPRIQNLNVNVTRVNEKLYLRDIETHRMDNIKIKVYSIARTCADCFRFRNKTGIDVAIEALKETIRRKKATIDEITVAAKYCRILYLMRPYLEAIVAS